MRAALRYIANILDVPFTIRLWDDTTVVLGSNGNNFPILSISNQRVVASLIKRPTLENILKHYAVGNIAFHGDSLLTAARDIRAKVKKQDMKRLQKKVLFRLLWPFIFVPSQKAISRHDFGKDVHGAVHNNKNNQNYIQFHYDISNEFYQLFLDSEMQYSCAYFRDSKDSLEQAQQNKLDLICKKLRLQKNDRFLDIGCGWGGLICYAAKHYGVKAHGVTLSKEQYEFTKEKIRTLGLDDCVTVEMCDYLTLDGVYDKIASIGMFEHIGIANFSMYLQKIHELLSPKGIMLNHGIARQGKRDSLKSLTHITPEKRLILKYIFPGAELAPIGHTINAMEAHGLEVHDIEALRQHYALTTESWYKRLFANKEKAINLVGLERYNLWIAYLLGVSFAFSKNSLLIYQTIVSKRVKGHESSAVPMTREDIYQ